MTNTVTDLIKNSFKHIEQAASCEFGLYGLSTGYTELDRILGGLAPGHLITVGGITGVGKSAFALNILCNLAIDDEIPVLLFSSEMNDNDIMLRILSQVCEIEISILKTGRLKPFEWCQLDSRIQRVQNKPLYIEATHQLYIEDVVDTARTMVREKGIKLIVVDYLQLMYYKTKMNDNRYVEINAIISQLKSLAMELNVPVIVISQLNRKIEGRGNDIEAFIPMLSDLRDSGTIASDSDEVVFIHRPEILGFKQDDQGNDLRGVAEVHVSKQRNGMSGCAKLRFRDSFVRFEDPNSRNQEYTFSMESDSKEPKLPTFKIEDQSF